MSWGDDESASSRTASELVRDSVCHLITFPLVVPPLTSWKNKLCTTVPERPVSVTDIACILQTSPLFGVHTAVLASSVFVNCITRLVLGICLPSLIAAWFTVFIVSRTLVLEDSSLTSLVWALIIVPLSESPREMVARLFHPHQFAGESWSFAVI